MGFGCSNQEAIEIIGEPFPQDVCNNFVPAELIPIRFSLAHVCKSIGKQMLLLVKSGFLKTSNKEKCR
jgi:hypothetical protein